MSPKVFKAIVLILVGLILASCQPAPSPTPPTATPLPADAVISEIIPSDGAEVTGNFLTVIWRTDPEAQGAVYWRPKGEEEYQRVEGTLTDRHQVTITGLESDQEYEFYVEAKLGEQTKTSEVRAFTVVPGLGFTQPLYEFNVERDYDQWAEVEVFNTDNRPHRLLVLPQADFPDLVVGFLGLGSRDEMFDLPGGETKLMRFIIFAQDATQEEYTFPIVLYNMDGREDISEVEDVPFATATVRVQVRIPRIDLQFEKIAEDPYTLAQTWQITNQGEYFADMAILPSPELEGRIYTIPSATHTEMHSGQSRDYIIVPFLDLGFQGLEGEVLVRGAGAEESFPVSFQVPEGTAVYIGFSQSGAGAGSSDSGCTNRGEIDTDLPSGPPPPPPSPPQPEPDPWYEEWYDEFINWMAGDEKFEYSGPRAVDGVRGGELRPWVLQAYPDIQGDNFESSSNFMTADAIYTIWHSDEGGFGPVIVLGRDPREEDQEPFLLPLSDPERAARWAWLTHDQQGHLVLLWESAAGNQPSEVAWSWSGDSGLTWSQETLLTSHREGAYDPVPLFANGLLYMVWEDHRDGYGRVYFTISEDNGESFGPQRPISPSGQNIEWPWIDVDPTGTIHIVYEAKEGGIGQVYYTRSEDDGETFSAPVRLSTPGEDTGEPRIYVFPERDEIVHITYRAGNGNNSELFYLQSVDGGATWSDPLQVTDDQFYSEYPHMGTTRDDRLWIMFHSNYHGVTDAEYFVFSEDNGATWGDFTRWPSRDEAVTAAWLEVNFQPQYSRRDFGQALQTTHISVNGQEVGTIVDQILEGTYLFPVDLDLLNFWSMKDLAANRITVFTEVVNGAHYRRTANFRLLLDYRYLEVPVVASSQEEADRIAQGPLPNVNHDQPDIGLFANLVEPIPVQPEDSQELNVRLEVFNLGQGSSSEITVRVFNGDPEKGGVEIADPQTLTGLEPGEETVINIPLTYISRFASATEYLTQVYIVASTEIPDFYLTNNTHMVTFVLPERESPLAETDARWVAEVPSGPAGTLVFTVYDTEGNITSDAQILVYPEGDRTNSIAQSGDNPATLELPQGTYDILARHADLEQWVEGVVVRADEESEASAQFTLGTLTFTIRDVQGIITSDARIFVYPRGEKVNSLFQSDDNPATFSLPPGPYDIRAIHRSLEQWVEGVSVRSGQTTEAETTFQTGELEVTVKQRGIVKAYDLRVSLFPAGDHRNWITYNDDNPARFTLFPGEYDILVTLGEAEEWLEGIEVQTGEITEREVDFDIAPAPWPTPPPGQGNLAFTVYSSPGVEASVEEVTVYPAGDHRDWITYTSDNPAVFSLNPGTYDLQVELYGQEKWVTGLSVQQGKTEEETLTLSFGHLLFTTYQATGWEAPGQEVTVYPAGDHRNWITYTHDNPAPFTLLAGTYDVQVKLFSEERWIPGLVVESGQTTEASTTFTFGRLTITVYESPGVQAESVETTIYPAGDPTNWITYSYSNPVTFPLLAGTYDVRVRLFGKEKWIPGLVVESGQTTEGSASFTFGRLTITTYQAPGIEAENPLVEVFAPANHERSVDWTYGNPATFPLLAGTYDVRVEYQDKEVWVEGVEVREGETTETEATFP